jgi:polyferredoxin/Flp pilus assembly protein TadD
MFMESGCQSAKGKGRRTIQLPVLNSSEDKSAEVARSSTSRWRALSLATLCLLMVLHFIQWRLMGTTVSPIEPSETMYTLQNGAINAGMIFFALAIAATLIFGRFVCGWGCHIVALQDLCSWLLEKIGLRPRPFRSRLLVFVPLVAALYMFVWPTVLWAWTKPKEAALVPGFTNHLLTTEFWTTFPPLFVAIPFLFICGFVTVYFLGSKGFCTYACPYGGFFGLADKLAPGKIRVTDACNQCGHCTATCTSNVLVHAEVAKYGMVVDPGCMKCMDCISVCPNDALYFGFGKPAILVGRDAAAINNNYALSWPEEIAAAVIFAASYLAVWDVYQLVPMLMALGIAAVTTYIALRTWKLLRSEDLSFYRYKLKSTGKIQVAGWVFLTFALLWIGVNAHSGFIRYNEFEGKREYQAIQIPDELALARTNPVRWLSATDIANIPAGKHHFQTVVDLGLVTNPDVLARLAWLEYLSGDTETSVQLLKKAADHQQGQARALSLYYRGAMLNRFGRYDDAMSDLDAALKESPDLILAREERGESLWNLGRRQEAAQVWADAVRLNPDLILANYLLAGAAASLGKPELAADFEAQANNTAPKEPLFHWMIGMRLQNLGMNALAEKQFNRAIELNPDFRKARN